MTLKQVVLRYIKELGYYSLYLNYLKYGYKAESLIGAEKFIKGANSYNLFYIATNMAKAYKLFWPYTIYQFNRFIEDWCVPIMEIKRGDTVSAKTLDGKHEFDYKVFDVWFSKMEIETENSCFINIERISKVNGKKANFAKGWEFKKDINRLHKHIGIYD